MNDDLSPSSAVVCYQHIDVNRHSNHFVLQALMTSLLNDHRKSSPTAQRRHPGAPIPCFFNGSPLHDHVAPPKSTGYPTSHLQVRPLAQCFTLHSHTVQSTYPSLFLGLYPPRVIIKMPPLATIGILSIGEMGMGIAKLLIAHNYRVVTNLEGRRWGLGSPLFWVINLTSWFCVF